MQSTFSTRERVLAAHVSVVDTFQTRRARRREPPPLPLISLPEATAWEEFDQPTRTGFNYTLPHIKCVEEDYTSPSSSREKYVHLNPPGNLQTSDCSDLIVNPAKFCQTLGKYMTLNEMYSTKRQKFASSRFLVYKRNKGNGKMYRATSSQYLEVNQDQKSTSTKTSLQDLIFDAYFESGNMDRVYRVYGREYASKDEIFGVTNSSKSSMVNRPAVPNSIPFPFFVKADMEYDLYCENDLSTNGHIQWYFFSATIPKSLLQRNGSLKVRFNIRNMLKRSSLYNEGMLPAIFVHGGVQSDITCGWHHSGTNVCYYKNTETYCKKKTGAIQKFYTLSFVYDFEPITNSVQSGIDNLTEPIVVYIAHCYPYTFTHLQQYLLHLMKDPVRSRHVRRRVLCKTIAGNLCDLLTITNFSPSDIQEGQNRLSQNLRICIVLTARVHPGESNSSHIMHGILEFLTGESPQAQFLRHNFVFKIVPMLNPDGVIHGNYRCSLSGKDLNRRWKSPSPILFPTIFAVKSLISSLRLQQKVAMYCDIHGHSRKKNVFLYSCPAYEPESRREAARARLFAHVLCKSYDIKNGGYFSYSDCTFSIAPSKQGTGRACVWSEANVLDSFTLEASFFGVGSSKNTSLNYLHPAQYVEGQSQNLLSVSPSSHFTKQDLESVGIKLCHAFIPFFNILGRCSTISPFAKASSPIAKYSTTVIPPAEIEGSHCSRDLKEIFMSAVYKVIQNLGKEKCSENYTPLESYSFDASDYDMIDADNLLTTLENELPANFQNISAEESPGSDSDPSADDMDEKEIEKSPSWKNLLALNPANNDTSQTPTMQPVKFRTYQNLLEECSKQSNETTFLSSRDPVSQSSKKPYVSKLISSSLPTVQRLRSTKSLLASCAPMNISSYSSSIQSKRGNGISSIHMLAVKTQTRSRVRSMMQQRRINQCTLNLDDLRMEKKWK